MEKYSNTILYTAEILPQFAAASARVDHSTHVSPLRIEWVQKTSRTACSPLEKWHFTHSHPLPFLKALQ